MNLFRLYITEKYSLGIEVSSWVVALVLLLIVIFVVWRRVAKQHHVVEVNINLGGIGCMKICPTWEDIQIAHQIWTELVTRKAAIPFNPKDDVIVEVYDSWYALFQRTRQLIGDIPGKCIRRDKSTQQIVKIATDTLNFGLRPHLTKWQARYRNWWHNSEDALKKTTPQEHQKTFPQYAELVEEMLLVNTEMIEYAAQLRKIVTGTR
ncbi:MAG: hypothetical protein WCD47_01770 [Candidatus Sulfotelmatobacter sp.]